MKVIILKNNLKGSLVINNVFGKSLILDGGAQKEVSLDSLQHPQIQSLLEKRILSKIERKG